VPVLCKVAPSVADVHMEDVHRAGGVMAILGELDRAGLIHAELANLRPDPAINSEEAPFCRRFLVEHLAHAAPPSRAFGNRSVSRLNAPL